MPSPLYGNQLSHLQLQQGTLFLAFSAGRGRACPYIGSSIVRHSESIRGTREVEKKQVDFWYRVWELSRFHVPLTTSLPPPHSIVLKVPTLQAREKLPATSEGKQMLVCPFSEAGGWRPRARLLTRCPVQGHLWQRSAALRPEWEQEVSQSGCRSRKQKNRGDQLNGDSAYAGSCYPLGNQAGYLHCWAN